MQPLSPPCLQHKGGLKRMRQLHHLPERSRLGHILCSGAAAVQQPQEQLHVLQALPLKCQVHCPHLGGSAARAAQHPLQVRAPGGQHLAVQGQLAAVQGEDDVCAHSERFRVVGQVVQAHAVHRGPER